MILPSRREGRPGEGLHPVVIEHLKGRPSVEKHEALGSAVAQIERQFGKGAIMRMGDNPVTEMSAIPTGSLALDIALGIGGIPRGRIVEIYGPESSGKTTMVYHLIAQAQKRGGLCAFIDAEHAMDPAYAKNDRRRRRRAPALAARPR